MEKRDDSSLGKNLRSAEKKLTKGLIKWKLKRVGLPTPDEETMDKDSERIVDEAHKIMKVPRVSLKSSNKPSKNF
jgi:hypothetical protein